jgi:serine protease SohB
MDVLWDALGFAAKAAIVFVTVALCTAVVALALRPRRHGDDRLRLRVRPLHRRMRELAAAVRQATTPPREYRRLRRAERRAEKRAEVPERRVYVLDFHGDIVASAVQALREEVTALAGVARAGDEVVLRLESAGGAAHAYGLAASQLVRLKNHGLRLTVCVDKMAASGGYMMACVADEIVAAPFAIVGSIGVAAPLPNVHRLLDKHGVDFENVTAGKYKRTVSFLARNSEEGRQKFQDQIEETHGLFKDFVAGNRPALDIEAVATGEYWYGTRAHALGLADRLSTSDEVLMDKLDGAEIYQLSCRRPRPLRDRLADSASLTLQRAYTRLRTRANEERLV